MTKILLTVVTVLLSISAQAKVTCPEKATISFGDVVTRNVESRELEQAAGKTFELKKVSGKYTCLYEGAPLRVKLDTRSSGRSLVVSGSRDQVVAEYSVSLLQLRAGVIQVEEASFAHFIFEVDEDGCAFGQVPCHPLPVYIGETVLKDLTFTSK